MKNPLLSYATLTFVLTVSLFKIATAQDKYQQILDSATHFYSTKEYAKAGSYFAKATKINGNLELQNNRYNAACAWSLANEPTRAFKELNLILSGKNIIKAWDDPVEFHSMLVNDTDFDNLREDKRWTKIVARSEDKKRNFELNLDKTLADELPTIRKNDQALRVQLDTIRKNKGNGSLEEKELWKKIISSDSANLAKVIKLIDHKGWLSPSQVGYQGNQTIFLVIQHAGIAVQQKYLSLMRRAVKNGKALAKDLALLEDRVAMRTGKEQIYGSQISIDKATGSYYLFPVVDPDRLDRRRASVGLESISTYLKNSFGLTWSLEEYKNKLPELLAKIKK